MQRLKNRKTGPAQNLRVSRPAVSNMSTATLSSLQYLLLLAVQACHTRKVVRFGNSRQPWKRGQSHQPARSRQFRSTATTKGRRTTAMVHRHPSSVTAAAIEPTQPPEPQTLPIKSISQRQPHVSAVAEVRYCHQVTYGRNVHLRPSLSMHPTNRLCLLVLRLPDNAVPK